MFETGRGVQVDLAAALSLYLAAAKQRNPAALYRLALLHEHGRGVEKNAATAFSYFAQASAVGRLPAIQRMVSIFAAGELGVARDPALAQQWEELAERVRAATQGEDVARH